MSLITAHYGSPAYINYNIHVSQAPRFIFVSSPKCGCTTTKASLNIWHAAWHGQQHGYSSLGEIHDRAYNPLLCPSQVDQALDALLLHDTSYFRFTIFRDPISRIASAYESKLSWDSAERQHLNQALGRAVRSELPFRLFLERIAADETLRDMNEHWRLQTKQIAARLIKYNQFCRLETLEQDLLRVRDQLFPGLALGVFATRAIFPDNCSASARRLDALTQAELDLITHAYAEDLHFQAQLPPGPASNIRHNPEP
jgi:hypothetical protein